MKTITEKKKNIAENTVEINRDPIIGIQEPVDAFITKLPNLRLREHWDKGAERL